MKKVLLVVLLFVVSTGFAHAADAAAGKSIAGSCVACHGADGISKIPSFPNLAGQKEAYLAASLKSYKNGQRNHPSMTGPVKPLSDADIANLAAYYASLSACP
jgi:cytochrome c553